MKSELERYKDALRFLMNDALAGGHIPVLMLCSIQDKVDAILHPAPVFEPVEEIVGWVNVYQLKDGSIFPRNEVFKCEADANREAVQNRISCQPIKVTVSREKKQPVERSVTVPAEINENGDPYGLAEEDWCPFKKFTECHGKTGTLTFTWQEEP